jgi:hypothetical protein
MRLVAGLSKESWGADRAQYGKEIIKELAERLTSDFGNGFSKSNLEYMRRFYLAYPGREIQIAQTESGQSNLSGAEPPFTLSWSHYVFLLGLKDQERRFYEIEAAEQAWTLRDLKRQFNAGLYERLSLSRDRKAIHDLAYSKPPRSLERSASFHTGRAACFLQRQDWMATCSHVRVDSWPPWIR